ncbi:MAG: hypothetical protein ACXWPS_20965 [Ktedonobacteraceae bacterium]
MAKLPVGSTVAFQSLYATGMLDPTGTRSSAIQLHHIHLTLNGIGYSDFALSTLIQTCYGHHVLSDSTSDFILRLIRMAKSGVYEAYWQPRSLRTLLLRAEVAHAYQHNLVEHWCFYLS